MDRNHPILPARATQRGLTLIELMVGLTLGLIIATALLTLFANASASGQNLARSGVQIENGRYVSELLRDDIRLAGFFGETAVAGATYTTPDPCSNVPGGWSGVPFNLPSPVQGYTAADVVACLPDRQPGTDALVLRRLDVDAVDPATLPAANTQYYVQYSFCEDDVSNPRLLFTADRTQLILRNRACTAPNRVRAYVSRIYYLARCNRCDGAGDGVPTLKRVDLEGDQLVLTALADGVEQLRFEYGFDMDGNGSPDTYLTALGAVGASTSWANVMAVRVHFVTRSFDKVATSALAGAQHFELGGTGTVDTAADGYTRRAYSSTVRLINPSSVREAP